MPISFHHKIVSSILAAGIIAGFALPVEALPLPEEVYYISKSRGLQPLESYASKIPAMTKVAEGVYEVYITRPDLTSSAIEFALFGKLFPGDDADNPMRRYRMVPVEQTNTESATSAQSTSAETTPAQTDAGLSILDPSIPRSYSRLPMQEIGESGVYKGNFGYFPICEEDESEIPYFTVPNIDGTIRLNFNTGEIFFISSNAKYVLFEGQKAPTLATLSNYKAISTTPTFYIEPGDFSFIFYDLSIEKWLGMTSQRQVANQLAMTSSAESNDDFTILDWPGGMLSFSSISKANIVPFTELISRETGRMYLAFEGKDLVEPVAKNAPVFNRTYQKFSKVSDGSYYLKAKIPAGESTFTILSTLGETSADEAMAIAPAASTRFSATQPKFITSAHETPYASAPGWKFTADEATTLEFYYYPSNGEMIVVNPAMVRKMLIPTLVYCVGSVQTPSPWDINDGSLSLAYNDDGCYYGTLYLQPGSHDFRFYSYLGNWGEFALGCGPDDMVAQDLYSFELPYNSPVEWGPGRWRISDWPGGPLFIRLSIADMRISFSHDSFGQDPSIADPNSNSYFVYDGGNYIPVSEYATDTKLERHRASEASELYLFRTLPLYLPDDPRWLAEALPLTPTTRDLSLFSLQEFNYDSDATAINDGAPNAHAEEDSKTIAVEAGKDYLFFIDEGKFYLAEADAAQSICYPIIESSASSDLSSLLPTPSTLEDFVSAILPLSSIQSSAQSSAQSSGQTSPKIPQGELNIPENAESVRFVTLGDGAELTDDVVLDFSTGAYADNPVARNMLTTRYTLQSTPSGRMIIGQGNGNGGFLFPEAVGSLSYVVEQDGKQVSGTLARKEDAKGIFEGEIPAARDGGVEWFDIALYADNLVKLGAPEKSTLLRAELSSAHPIAQGFTGYTIPEATGGQLRVSADLNNMQLTLSELPSTEWSEAWSISVAEPSGKELAKESAYPSLYASGTHVAGWPAISPATAAPSDAVLTLTSPGAEASSLAPQSLEFNSLGLAIADVPGGSGSGCYALSSAALASPTLLSIDPAAEQLKIFNAAYADCYFASIFPSPDSRVPELSIETLMSDRLTDILFATTAGTYRGMIHLPSDNVQMALTPIPFSGMNSEIATIGITPGGSGQLDLRSFAEEEKPEPIVRDAWHLAANPWWNIIAKENYDVEVEYDPEAGELRFLSAKSGVELLPEEEGAEASGLSIIGVHGGVLAKAADRAAKVRLFTPQGTLAAEAELIAGEERLIPLPAGIYISASGKVIVK